MKNIKWINSLKLRAGYGVTGIAPSNPYLATYRLGYTSILHVSNSIFWVRSKSMIRV